MCRFSYFSVRVESPQRTTHVGGTTAPPNTCRRCFDSSRPCVRVGTKAGVACTLCRQKKKKCIPMQAQAPPADVKERHTAPLPKRALKKSPSVPTSKNSAAVPTTSQNPNRRPRRALPRASTGAQSDEESVVVIKQPLLHVASPPDPPPAKKKRMAKLDPIPPPPSPTPLPNIIVDREPTFRPSSRPRSPGRGGPYQGLQAQLMRIEETLQARLDRIEETLETRLDRIEDMLVENDQRLTKAIGAVENVHEFLVGFRNGFDHED